MMTTKKSEKRNETWRQQTMRRMEEALIVSALTSSDIPQYVSDRVPTPAKDETFRYESQDKETNPLLVELKHLPSSARLSYILWFALTLAIFGVAILLGYLTSLEFQETTIFGSPLTKEIVFGFTTGLAVTFTVAYIIKSTYVYSKTVRSLHKNISAVEALILESDAKF